MMNKLILCLALVYVLTSCAFTRADKAARAKNEMIGMSKPRVLACMGVPASKASEGSVEVWGYNSGGDSNTVGGVTATASGNYAYGFGSSKTFNLYCTINVVFQDDRVSAVNYGGRTGGLLTAGEQCAFAIDNCVQ